MPLSTWKVWLHHRDWSDLTILTVTDWSDSTILTVTDCSDLTILTVTHLSSQKFDWSVHLLYQYISVIWMDWKAKICGAIHSWVNWCDIPLWLRHLHNMELCKSQTFKQSSCSSHPQHGRPFIVYGHIQLWERPAGMNQNENRCALHTPLCVKCCGSLLTRIPSITRPATVDDLILLGGYGNFGLPCLGKSLSLISSIVGAYPRVSFLIHHALLVVSAPDSAALRAILGVR